jgi:Tol biopolymer transport system component
MNADGSGRTRLTQTPLRAIMERRLKGGEGRAWNNVAPTWSPDGSQLVFLTDRTGCWEIWVMPVPGTDGGNPQPLLPGDVQHQLGLTYNSVDERVLSWR